MRLLAVLVQSGRAMRALLDLRPGVHVGRPYTCARGCGHSTRRLSRAQFDHFAVTGNVPCQCTDGVMRPVPHPSDPHYVPKGIAR